MQEDDGYDGAPQPDAAALPDDDDRQSDFSDYGFEDSNAIDGRFRGGDEDVRPQPFSHERPEAFEVDDRRPEAFTRDDPEAFECELDDYSSSRQPWENSPWYKARFQLIHDGQDPSTGTTILQAAFHHVEAVHRGASIASVEGDIKRTLFNYKDCGTPHPDNPKCRYPPSYFVCKKVCGVSDLTEAEWHMCPSHNCTFHNPFPKMPRSTLLEHMAHCNDPTSCRLCTCECGGKRMYYPSPNSKPQPTAPCYFFSDVFQQFFYDRDWYAAAKKARAEKRGYFYQNPEGQRILEFFRARGFDVSNVSVLRKMLVLAWITLIPGIKFAFP